MRLNSIKLSGFKSFVDPTHLLLQSNLTAIVGPNGCGKSNIVDAIHCVLGSTSKNLRADNMSDVIFNGTTSRKPVGQASIELIFDNQEGRIGGEFAQYPEISIRRELGRDGQSTYYLNGIRCRRRDITDIFLGTGLGNNSYAIIEQGMISRLIEAKPEELRAHVEEAAGTSKYKERRRETENRIKHTRENLDRLNDVREEQNRQLNHLQKQANAAEKYKTLKAEQRLIRAQLQTILWQNLYQKIGVYDQKIMAQETALEAKIAELRNVDKEIEYKRSLRAEHNDVVNEVQGQYYSLGAEIAKIEQSITHAKERKKQLENDYQQLENSYQELKDQHFEDQNQMEELQSEIQKVECTFKESKEKAEHFHVELKSIEEKMHAWQERWDHFNQISAQASKQAEVEKTKIHHLEQKQQAINTRLARIQAEQTTQGSEHLVEEVSVMRNQQKSCYLELEALQERLNIIQETIQLQKQKYQDAQQEVGKATKDLRDLQAQNASMQALQQIALGKNNEQKKNWLAKHNLENHQRLAEEIIVDSGWEVAVETVLVHHLDAICTHDFESLVSAIEGLQLADVTFFNMQAFTHSSQQNKNLVPLISKVQSKGPVANLLHAIYVTESLQEALQQIHLLEAGESIVTRDGVWLSASWLRVSRSASEKTGVIQREHDIKALQQQIGAQQQCLSKHEALLHEAQEQLHLENEQRETVLQQLQNIKAKNSDLLAQIQAKESYIQQLKSKEASLQSEMTEILPQLDEVIQNLETAHSNLKIIKERANDDETNRQAFLAEKDTLRINLDEVRQQANMFRQKSDESQVRVESMRSQMHFLTQNISRVERQLAGVNERRQTIQESLDTINDPLPELDTTLQQTLEKRAIVEEQLNNARHALGSLETELQSFEKNRQQIENNCQELRSFLEEMRLECQTFKVKLTTYVEQIEELGFKLEELKQALPENAEANIWEENLNRIDMRIQRLGPINLAAIEEYAELLERKQYLDKQHDDLIEALTTLENAIRKIDRETRIRFKETFTLLNENFRNYFQQIFVGGEAYLELTSDDLLETGVIVRAQPPGKRNSTIHLLSGGEKALTAIALVFAIFSLNPAPFCVLDEVDAPLDDVNIGRFCNLVKKMAEKIQFIFISHNKITIEMGQQLAGVTMNEPGVSRLVSVDVEQAISMANA